MGCKSPLWVKLNQPKMVDGLNMYSVPVNCGKCIYCKKQRITGWSFRLIQEEKASNNVYFITLTYDSNNIPYCKINPDAKVRKKEGLENRYDEQTIKDNITKVPTLCKADVQDFMKRLREVEKEKYGKLYKEVDGKEVAIVDAWYRKLHGIEWDYNRSLKYYAVGEYGTKNRRPHYHVIIFNLYDSDSITDAWQKGSVDVKEAHVNSVLYTLKYLEKETKHYKYIYAMDLQPEFSLSSKRLGENYVTDQMTNYHMDNYNNNVITLPDGTKGKIPRYLFQKMYKQVKAIDRHENPDVIKQKMDEYLSGLYGHIKKEKEEKDKREECILGKTYFVSKRDEAKRNLNFKEKNLRKL